MPSLCSVLFPAISLGWLLGCTSTQAPLRTVERVDLPRYMGNWFVVGEIPYLAEKDCVDSLEHYSLRSDGGIENWFDCRKKYFDAPLKRVATSKVKVIDTRT